MQFILSTGWEEGMADLTERLIQELSKGKHVLWLVTGGSNIEASVTIMNNISDGLSTNLTVMLADERYGKVGHTDSNWAQLMAAGFDGKQARLLPVLRDGDSFEEAANYYNQIAQKAFDENEVVVSQMGIGPDGHIAGILPESVAGKEPEALVAGYSGGPYQRLTMTFPALRRIAVDYSFAFGEGKRQALESLRVKTTTLLQQPAQILWELPEAYVYNDQIGDQK
ncbi:MAG TPA: 6-phosphogluconolactonase [Candidatus Saccharimonadales bacterium]|nr:6-phosphogluconolactonase [Candidatus Saccharimonadales bacterium]